MEQQAAFVPGGASDSASLVTPLPRPVLILDHMEAEVRAHLDQVAFGDLGDLERLDRVGESHPDSPECSSSYSLSSEEPIPGPSGHPVHLSQRYEDFEKGSPGVAIFQVSPHAREEGCLTNPGISEL